MRIAILSIDVRAHDLAANFAAASAGLRAAASGGAKLVCLPEMWPTSFTQGATDEHLSESHQAVGRLMDLTGELGLAAVGSAYGPRRGARGLPTNRVTLMDRGRIAAYHDKVHLFTPTAEHLAFAAGDEPPPVARIGEHGGSKGVLVSPMICYDLRFPDVARMAFRQGAELLTVSAQWPDRRAPHWAALIGGRAAETMGFVAACNRIGQEEVGRRRMRLSFGEGMSMVARPSGERVEPDSTQALAEAGGGASRLAHFDLDLGEVEALRRAVPVREDERGDLIRKWWSEA